jgi:hypothetical protein
MTTNTNHHAPTDQPSTGQVDERAPFPAYKPSGKRIMELIEEARQLTDISSTGPIPLTLIQIGYIVGHVAADAARASLTPTAPADERQRHVEQVARMTKTNFALAGTVNDLAALARRLLHALNFADPGNGIAKVAANYLKRENLQGDPIRAEDVLRDSNTPTAPQAASQHIGATFENPGHKDCYCGGWTDDTGDFHNLGCPEPASQAATTASAITEQSATTIVQDIADLFAACGFEIRDNGPFSVIGSLDAAGVLVEAVIERFSASGERGAVLDEVAASIKSSFRPEDRLDPDYIAQCILSHKGRAQAPSQSARQIKTWQDRMPEPWWEKVCDMNCSPRPKKLDDCPDCVSVKRYGDPIVARDAEIAELRAALARAPLPAQQDGAVDVARDADPEIAARPFWRAVRSCLDRGASAYSDLVVLIDNEFSKVPGEYDHSESGHHD